MLIQRLALWFVLLFSSMEVKALTPVTMCIWDPVGTHGPFFSFFFDLKVRALNWGVDLDMQAYETEHEALDRLEQKKCDLSVVTAILARDYVHFGGSLDAIGAVRNQKQLRLLLSTLTAPKLRQALRQDKYEIAAILPVGPMYAFVNNREISDLSRLRRKNISALNADIQTKKLAKILQARSVDTTITNFADKFKRKKVDIVLMPALAYSAFELEQAMRHDGGVLDIRFFNGMLQGIANTDKLNDNFAIELRQYMHTRADDIFKLIKDAEEEIPKHYWIHTDPNLKSDIEWLFKDIRLELMVEDKLDKRALNLLWRIRCKTDSSHEECVG